MIRLEKTTTFHATGALTGALCVALIAISSQSLWIDEAVTAWFASMPSLHNLYEATVTTDMSEAFSPGYVAYMWIWVQIFGESELALRYSNLPFFIALIGSLILLPKERYSRGLAGSLLALSPLTWFYLNEARAYIPLMSLGGISLMLIILYTSTFSPSRRSVAFAVVLSIVIGMAFNMLFLFAVPPLAATFFLLCRKEADRYRVEWKHWTRPLTLVIPIVVALVAYYLHATLRGSGGIRETPGIKNVGFVLYEFAGLMGVGPPRNILRSSIALETFTPYLLPMGVSLALLLTTVSLFVYAVWERRTLLVENPFLVAAVLGFLFFFAFAYAFGWRMLGRHVLFLHPFVILGICHVLGNTRDQRRIPTPWIVVAPLLIVWIYSDANLRCNPVYQKEDYRTAANISLERIREGGMLLWCADPYAGSYYGLEFDGVKRVFDTPVRGPAINCTNLKSAQQLLKRVGPQVSALLVLGRKSDIFDPHDVVSNLLRDKELVPIVALQDFYMYEIHAGDLR